MKGFIFSEFLELVEDRFGYSFIEEMINETSSDGIYTSVSSYPVEELVEMVLYISEKKMFPLKICFCCLAIFCFPGLLLHSPISFTKMKHFSTSLDNCMILSM